MSSTSLSSVLKILLTIYLWQQQRDICFGYEFDRKYFGVLFSPYVKNFEDGQPLELYTRKNLETMLQVISTKFSNVIVAPFIYYGNHIFNHTYHYDSYEPLHSGEIVAQMNKETKSKKLTIMFLVNHRDNNEVSLAEIDLAIKAAEIANEIYAGSVEGIIIEVGGVKSAMNQSLMNLQSVRNKTTRLGIKLGLSGFCDEILSTFYGAVSKLGQEIVRNSDFLICTQGIAVNPRLEFLSLAKNFLSHQQVALGIRPTTEIIGMTTWSSAKLKDWQTVDNLRVVWETASRWSAEKHIRVYLSEAFNVPRRRLWTQPEHANLGWWKLTDNSKINSDEGYVEKATVGAQCQSFLFDRAYVGVAFSPNVAPFSAGDQPLDTSDYTFDNIQAMLTVASVRFSNILLSGPFGDNDQYEYDVTYHKSWPVLRSAEAAALLNQMHASKLLTLMYHVSSNASPNKVKTEFLLACEAAEKANKVFPGTVESIIVGTKGLTLETAETLRNWASNTKVKFGTEIELINLSLLLNEDSAQWENFTKIAKMSDYIVCSIYPINAQDGPTASFRNLSSTMLAVAHVVTGISSGKRIIALTRWSSSGRNKWSTVENQRIFWETASRWAAKEKIHIFLEEAFDNPWRKTNGEEDLAHLGWWRLDNLKKINSVKDYVEKISELPGQCTSPPPKISQRAHEAADGKATNGAWTTTNTLSVATVGVIILFIAVGIAVWARTSITVISSNEVREFFHGSVNSSMKEAPEETAHHRPYDKSLEVARKNIKLGSNILGKGEFGLVFKAQVELDGELVDAAVKVPKDNCPSATLKGLLSEIKIMSYLGTHANIVALMGAYTAELSQGVVYVMMEICSLGSLQNYLRKCRGVSQGEKKNHNADNEMEMQEVVQTCEISFSSMVRWANEIACGMEHLASKHVVHADLATRNVLLSSSKTAKISDFGLSRRMYNYKNYVKKNQEPLPWRWMAFESLDRMEFSSKSDVWSYGITLWEIFSKGSVPYSGISWTHDYTNELQNGLRPNRPQLASPEIFELMQNCWELEPSGRPTFSEISSLTDTLFQKEFDMKNEEESAYLPIREIE